MTFKGNTDGLKGNVFQCHGENTDKQQFLKTIGALGEHINKTFTYPQDAASVCKSFKVVALVQPANLTKADYKDDLGDKHEKLHEAARFIESNTRAIYAIVWGQCSPMMQSKIESLADFDVKSDSCNCIWIIKEIQGITHRFEGARHVFISLHDAWTGYYTCKQGHQQTLHEYLKDFQGLVQVLEHYGAALGADGPYQESIKAQVVAAAPTGLSTEEYLKLTVAYTKRSRLPSVF
jgi:hypothetical protein